MQTNAVYGFVTMMLRVLEDLRPTHLVVAFDLPEPTFRQQQYTAYQAKRPEMESNLADQIPLLHELLDALNIPHFSLSGFEADDIIGTLAVSGKQLAVSEIIIVSGDRDMLQLVNGQVKVCVPVKGLVETKMYDEKLVRQEFGVTPSQWVDVKALKGDASDNYSGVRGIGPKTAQNLIAQYGTLEDVYKNLKSLPPKVATKLAEGVEDAGLAQKLAKIVTDVPVHLDLEKADISIIDWKLGVKYMREKLGFKSITEKLEKKYKTEEQLGLI
jgi:DNA polymerase-1